MSIKKTIITTILALALVAVAVPAVTSADTLSDAYAALAAAQAQLNLLQGTTPQTPGNCTGVQFVRTLVIGSTGSDVKCLQTLLNLSPTTQVAITGAGSPGSETSYFGSLTLSAVRKYQVQHGWTPANQVGPLTRAALNAQIAGGVVINPPVVIPTTGCSAGALYNSITGASCVVIGLPTGCTSTVGFSPVTGVSCSTGVVTQVVGTTGFIDASTLAAIPSSNASVTTTSNVPVLGINVKAINANMTVNSLKVQLAVTKSAVAEHPATLVNKLYVYDGSTLLGTFGVDTNSVYKTSDGKYYVILSGFNFPVPANTTKVLTVKADFAPALETNRQLTINLFDTASVGAIDGTGASRTSGVATTRVYTVAYQTVGSSTLTVTASTTTPVSTSINVNATSGTTDIPMLVLNARSTVGASTITDLVVTLTGSATLMDNITAVTLYDGINPLNSVSPVVVNGTTSTATFSNLAIAIAKDAVKALTVKVNLAATVADADTLTLSVTPTTQVTYQLPNLSSAFASGATVTGKTMSVFNGQTATFALVTGTATYTPSPAAASAGTTNGIIILRVTPTGGTLTKPVTADFTVNAYVNDVLVGAAVSKLVTVYPNDDVADGESATVTINVSEPITASGAGYVDFRVANIKWVVSDGVTTTTVTNQTWGLTDFRTTPPAPAI